MTNAERDEHMAEIKRLCASAIEDISNAPTGIREELAGWREDQNAAVERALDLYLGKRED